MSNHDEKILSVDVDTVNAVTLDDARSAIMSQHLPENIKNSAPGDFDVQEVSYMILKYVGTILPLANSEYRLEDKVSEDTLEE
jgi:hypothetical protein